MKTLRCLIALIMGGMLLQGTVLADAELDQLIAQLRRTQYTNAVQKAYQKRLLSILPSISNGAPIDTVIANANGTTALHNACGLSHVEIVRWLVNHGANTQAKTAKGASVAACVAQPNAAAINKILKGAKSPKTAPVAAGMAPQSVKGKSITFWKDGSPLSDQSYTFRQGNKNVLANNIPNGYGNALNYTKTGNNTAQIVVEEWESSTTYYLTFTSPTEGTAWLEGSGEGEEWTAAGLTFTMD